MISLIICGILFCSSLFGVEMRPVPWLTEGAIAFLERYLEEHPRAKILEFGGGSSTMWFAKKDVSITTVEHNPAWYRAIEDRLAVEGRRNVHLILKSTPYYTTCDQLPRDSFDLVLVDGRNRKGCILHSIPLLKKGGVLMLDNAERPYYRGGIDLLKGWRAFSDVQKKPDSCGFCYPGWTTSWWINP
jgi:predicted O-methyltransferase YrrM